MSSMRQFMCGIALLAWCGAAAAVEVPAPQAAKPPRPFAVSKVKLPAVDGDKIVAQSSAEDFTVKLDLSTQVLRAHAPKSESWREPNEWRKGDTASVLREGATISAGQSVIARLSKGQLLTVSNQKEGWVAVAAPVDGKPRTGWIRATDIKLSGEESPLHPVLPSLSYQGTASASLLAQKSKQFDDGLYAAVELAAQQGSGKFAGKAQLLSKLSAALARLEAGQVDESLGTVLAAGRLGGLKAALPAPIERIVAARTARFMASPVESKPLAFYTWSEPLASIFRQDRILQQRLTDAAGAERIARLLHGDPALRATYEGYLDLTARLTNPHSRGDLRPQLAALDKGSSPSHDPDASFFPPSASHETDLIVRLYGDRPIPEGFNLADEMIKRVQAGELDLTPRPNSGWYDRQTWSLAPLVLPDQTPEAERIKFDETYRKLLLELFKGALALWRETHIKQLDVPPAAKEAADGPEKPKPKLFLHPELSAEPLATSYRRRAESYRYVRGVLEDVFGAEALATMHRLTAAGPVKPNLAEELSSMEGLFAGAYAAVCRQLGMPPASAPAIGTPGGFDADAKAFLDWSANLDLDPDLAQDARMMVPVFYDVERRKTKVWAFLGWTTRHVEFAYQATPAVSIFDKQGQPVAKDAVEVHFHSQWTELVYPVTAEVYVDQILNRDEFRKHCDAYQTQSAILRNLN